MGSKTFLSLSLAVYVKLTFHILKRIKYKGIKLPKVMSDIKEVIDKLHFLMLLLN